MHKQWTINLNVSGSTKIVEISESIQGSSFKTNAGSLMIYHNDKLDPDKKILNIRGIGNSAVFNMNIVDIVHPLIGSDSYETYTDKMSQYINGDITKF